MNLRSTALFMILLLGSVAAQAANYEIDMSGSSIPSYVYQAPRRGDLYTFTDYQLTTTAASGVAPGLTVFADDSFSGTVTMSGAVTMAASLPTSTLGIVLEGIDDDATYIELNQSVSLYLKGQLVDVSAFTSAGAQVDGGALSFDILGGWFMPSPALTFDEITFTAQVTGIDGGDGSSADSALLDASQPYLYFQTYAPLTAVPEVSSGWLMLAGLAFTGALVRQRRV